MVRYRLWQFWQIVTAVPLEPAARTEIATLLTASELALFDRFALNDQWHSYRVMKMLQQAGHTQPALLIAALLHDVGKTKLALSIWERSLIVLASILLPRQTAVWGKVNRWVGNGRLWSKCSIPPGAQRWQLRLALLHSLSS